MQLLGGFLTICIGWACIGWMFLTMLRPARPLVATFRSLDQKSLEVWAAPSAALWQRMDQPRRPKPRQLARCLAAACLADRDMERQAQRVLQLVHGHSELFDPPSATSAWRNGGARGTTDYFRWCFSTGRTVLIESSPEAQSP